MFYLSERVLYLSNLFNFTFFTFRIPYYPHVVNDESAPRDGKGHPRFRAGFCAGIVGKYEND